MIDSKQKENKNQQLEVELSQTGLEIRCKILPGKAVKHWNSSAIAVMRLQTLEMP